ncbi:hypothetical protein D3C75_529200 [compost metagenome]
MLQTIRAIIQQLQSALQLGCAAGQLIQIGLQGGQSALQLACSILELRCTAACVAKAFGDRVHLFEHAAGIGRCNLGGQLRLQLAHRTVADLPGHKVIITVRLEHNLSLHRMLLSQCCRICGKVGGNRNGHIITVMRHAILGFGRINEIPLEVVVVLQLIHEVLPHFHGFAFIDSSLIQVNHSNRQLARIAVRVPGGIHQKAAVQHRQRRNTQ